MDLVHSIVVDFMRRTARCVCNYLVKAYKLGPKQFRVRTGEFRVVPHRHKRGRMFKLWLHETRRESRTDMILGFVKRLPKKDLLELWRRESQVGGRLVMYSHTFYTTLVADRGVEGFKSKYDPVLGAAYPEDISTIKNIGAKIVSIDSLSGMFRQLQYPLNDDNIHRLCLWAIETNEGYGATTRSDPLDGGWKNSMNGSKSRRVNPAVVEGREQEGGFASFSNRFAVLDDEEDKS